jgi:hypothetical protein
MTMLKCNIVLGGASRWAQVPNKKYPSGSYVKDKLWTPKIGYQQSNILILVIHKWLLQQKKNGLENTPYQDTPPETCAAA